jgi:hypothetical protein
MRGAHLEAREEATVDGDSGRRRNAARCDDERLARMGRRGNRDNQPVTILTPRRSSGGGLRRQRSGGMAERRTAEARRQWRRWLGLREAGGGGCEFYGTYGTGRRFQ